MTMSDNNQTQQDQPGQADFTKDQQAGGEPKPGQKHPSAVETKAYPEEKSFEASKSQTGEPEVEPDTEVTDKADADETTNA
jgi:hypothetical protein